MASSQLIQRCRGMRGRGMAEDDKSWVRGEKAGWAEATAWGSELVAIVSPEAGRYLNGVTLATPSFTPSR